MQPDPNRLRTVPLFADLGPDDLERVALWLQIREDTNVGSLGPGDFFGEMAMMGDGRRVADVVATSPITLFEMFGTHFQRARDDPARDRRTHPRHARGAASRALSPVS